MIPVSIPENWLPLVLGGLGSGVLAGLLGIGGGTVLVPFLVALGYTPVQSVATSSLAIVITSISGSIQNWRMGNFDPKRVLGLGFPALVTAQLGVAIANWTKHYAPYLLLVMFGFLLWLNIYLVDLRKRLTRKAQIEDPETGAIATAPLPWNPGISRLVTGSAAGVLAGLFGVGGGVIMVPLQILLLGEPIKLAIQTSLGVIIITAISASLGHAHSGNIAWAEGIMLGLGGLVGAQVSTRVLPKLPDEMVSLMFRAFLGVLSFYIFWQAWEIYQGGH